MDIAVDVAVAAVDIAVALVPACDTVCWPPRARQHSSSSSLVTRRCQGKKNGIVPIVVGCAGTSVNVVPVDVVVVALCLSMLLLLLSLLLLSVLLLSAAPPPRWCPFR